MVENSLKGYKTQDEMNNTILSFQYLNG